MGILQAGCLSSRPANSVKSTEGNSKQGHHSPACSFLMHCQSPEGCGAAASSPKRVSCVRNGIQCVKVPTAPKILSWHWQLAAYLHPGLKLFCYLKGYHNKILQSWQKQSKPGTKWQESIEWTTDIKVRFLVIFHIWNVMLCIHLYQMANTLITTLAYYLHSFPHVTLQTCSILVTESTLTVWSTASRLKSVVYIRH